MALLPVAGCKFWVSTNPFAELAQDAVTGDFSSVAWIEVKKWTTMGAYGDTAQLISTDLIGEGRTKKQKGSKNAGSMANTFAADALDLGQQKLVTASQSNQNYAFKVELNDKVATANGKREFYGLVMSAQQSGGGANTIQNMDCTIEINSNIVVTAAT